MKILLKYWPLAAIAAGLVIAKRNRSVSGIGKLDREKLHKQLDEYMIDHEKKCNHTVTAYFPSLNKNETLQQYLRDGEEYDLGDRRWDYADREWVQSRKFMNFDEKAVCTSCVNFNQSNYKLYEFLCNSLMSPYSIFKGRGGSYCDDPRLDQYESMWQVPRALMKELQSAGAFYHGDCILISFNNIPQFVVDPQGYEHARYIGFVSTFNTWLS